jgi:16S rRNA (uracil1498-N3)-methyltransferase
MHHFWGIRQGADVALLEDEAHHAHKVLRLNDGDVVRVLDGLGSAWEGPLHFLGKRGAVVARARELPSYGSVSGCFHLVIAPTKNMDRIEWLLEKAVELGVHRVSLVECARSERRHLKLDRLVRVMQAACKQSQKGMLPELDGPTPFSERMTSTKGRCALAALRSESAYLPELIRAAPNEPWTVFIGPEGDFTDAEISEAQSHGAVLVGLGPHRLRTETAGLYAVAAFAQRLSL